MNIAHETLLSVPQAAMKLGVSGPTLRRWIKAGELAAIQLGPNHALRIDPGEIERFIRVHQRSRNEE